MNNYNRVGFVAASLIIAAFSLSSRAADAPAPTTCKDGTTSTATGRGACSGHGGVQKGLKSAASSGVPSSNKAAEASTAPSAPASASASSAPGPTAAAGQATKPASKAAPTATAGNSDPAGATAKCKDGTFSHSQHHSGTCSSHGGVAQWLTSAQ